MTILNDFRTSPVGTELVYGSPVAITDRVDSELARDMAGAYSLSTIRSYRAAWADWVAWCARTHNRPLPATPRSVRDYLVDLASARRLATLQHRLAAVRRAHAIAGHKLELDDVLRTVMRRLAKEKGRARAGRAPVSTDDIVRMLRKLPTDLRGVRDRALLLLGFAGGLRRSELVDLEVNAIEWRQKGIVLKIRRSKTDQEGRGHEVGIEYGERDATCPVRALKKWLAQSGITEGPIFRPIDGRVMRGHAMCDKMVALVVKRAAIAAGIDPAQLAGHSLRSGHVTQALENGASLYDAQKQLRHTRSETTQVYDRGKALRNSTSGKLGL